MLPIIALDPDAIEGNRGSHISAGYTDSMVKPIEPRRVAAILKDCLPEDKLQERSDDIRLLIEGSRFREGLLRHRNRWMWKKQFNVSVEVSKCIIS